MKNYNAFVTASANKKSVFDLMEVFVKEFDEKIGKGYVSTYNRTENSIDVTIGWEKFTIMSYLDVNGKTTFSVFGWEFDLSSLTRYSHIKIEKLSFYLNGTVLTFKYQPQYDNADDTVKIVDLSSVNKSIEPIFNEMEKYIEDKEAFNKQHAV